MNCREFEENIPSYTLNDPCVSQDERLELESHMTVCSKCHEVYLDTKGIIELMRENKEREAAKSFAALEAMTDEEVAEELASSEPVEIPGLPSFEESWAQLKAKMERQDEEERHAARAKRFTVVRSYHVVN